MQGNRLFVNLSPFCGCLFCLLCYFVVLLRCVWGVYGVFIGDVMHCITVYCVVVGVLVGILSRNTIYSRCWFLSSRNPHKQPVFCTKHTGAINYTTVQRKCRQIKENRPLLAFVVVWCSSCVRVPLPDSGVNSRRPLGRE